MKAKSIWIVITATAGIAAAASLVHSYRKLAQNPKPVAPATPPTTMVAPEETEAGGKWGPDEIPVRTRPATAEEVAQCEEDATKIEADWPIQRIWSVPVDPESASDFKCMAKHTLQFKNQKQLTFTDAYVNWEQKQSYAVEYYKKAGFFAVRASYYEIGQLFLISEQTGETTKALCDGVFFSPSMQFVLANCMQSDGPSNEIMVWSIKGTKLTPVFKSGPIEWWLQDPAWLDDNTIGLIEPSYDDEAKPRKKAQLKYTGSSWNISS